MIEADDAALRYAIPHGLQSALDARSNAELRGALLVEDNAKLKAEIEDLKKRVEPAKPQSSFRNGGRQGRLDRSSTHLDPCCKQGMADLIHWSATTTARIG